MSIEDALPLQKKKMDLAGTGFEPATSGLWAQHASHCATLLPHVILYYLLYNTRAYFFMYPLRSQMGLRGRGKMRPGA